MKDVIIALSENEILEILKEWVEENCDEFEGDFYEISFNSVLPVSATITFTDKEPKESSYEPPTIQ